MGENEEKGHKWWLRYAIIPIIVAIITVIGGGIFSIVKITSKKPPLPPSNLKIGVYNNNGGLQIVWTDNADNEKGFKIYRKQQSSFQLVGTTSQNIQEYIDNHINLQASKNFSYEVCSFNSAGESERIPIAIRLR